MSEETTPKEHGWQTLSSKIAYKNPWIQIQEDKVIRPDGSEGLYGIVDTYGPSVFVVPMNAKQEIYLIHQYRYPTQMYSWELPAGRCDGDEPLVAAKRELQEETGLIANTWEKVGTIQALNGLCNETSHIFLAQDLTQTDNHEQAEEGIMDVKSISMDEIFTMIKEGELTDSQTIAAMSQARLYLN